MTLINLGTATFLRVVVPVCLLSADKTTFPPETKNFIPYLTQIYSVFPGAT